MQYLLRLQAPVTYTHFIVSNMHIQRSILDNGSLCPAIAFESFMTHLYSFFV